MSRQGVFGSTNAPPGDKKSAMGRSGAMAQNASSNCKGPKYNLVVAKCPIQNIPSKG